MFRTIITTEIDEPNPSQSESCRRQVSRMRMDSCRRLLQSQMLFPQMDVQQMQRQCCQELQEVNQECMCEAVRQIAQSSTGSQGGQQQQHQIKELMRRAQQLPMMCGIQSQPCQIYEANTHQSGKCRSQLSGVRMESCRRYLQPHMLFLPRIDTRQLQQQCCQELQEVNPECMCEAIRQTVQSLTGSEGGQQQQQLMQETIRKAQQLPMMCGMQSQSCQISEANAHKSESRRRQLSGMRMDSCRRYLQPQMLLLPTMDMEQMQQECCEELQEVNPECVCEAIRQTVQTVRGSQKGQQQPQQTQEVMRKAQQLPRMCGVQAQSCDLSQNE